MRPTPDWIRPEKLAVLRDVCAALTRAAIPFMAVGGLAGNLWGSSWPLQDLDFDVPTDALARVSTLWPDAELTFHGRYVDSEFDMPLLRLRVQEVEIDLSGAEDALVVTPSGARGELPNTLARRTMRTLGDLEVPCQRLEDLIDYKERIGRTADVADLRRLLNSRHDALGRNLAW
jgi:hypothetical protein